MSGRRKMARTKADRMNQSIHNASVEQSYEVEAILQKQIKYGKSYYLVSWKGFNINQATWQPRQNLNNCSSLVVQFQINRLSQQDKYALEQEENQPLEVEDKPLDVNKRLSLKNQKQGNEKYQSICPGSQDSDDLEGIGQEQDWQNSRIKVVKIVKSFFIEEQAQVPDLFCALSQNGKQHLISKDICYLHYPRLLLNYYESLIE